MLLLTDIDAEFGLAATFVFTNTASYNVVDCFESILVYVCHASVEVVKCMQDSVGIIIYNGGKQGNMICAVEEGLGLIKVENQGNK